MGIPKPLRLATMVTVAALFAASCGGADESDAAPAQAATEDSSRLDPSVFQGEAALVNGDSIDLAGLADQDLVLWFWAPW